MATVAVVHLLVLFLAASAHSRESAVMISPTSHPTSARATATTYATSRQILLPPLPASALSWRAPSSSSLPPIPPPHVPPWPPVLREFVVFEDLLHPGQLKAPAVDTRKSLMIDG